MSNLEASEQYKDLPKYIAELHIKTHQLAEESMRLEEEVIDLKIDQLTGKVMRLEAEIGRLRQGGAHRRNRK